MPVLPWPREGLIEFKHLFLKYVATDPPVLKDLNIVINPGEKVILCLLALFNSIQNDIDSRLA